MYSDKKWEQVPKEKRNTEEIARPSISYWKSIFIKLSKNNRAIVGSIFVVLLVFAAVIGPMLTSFRYSDQAVQFRNLQPFLSIYKLDDNLFVHLTREYRLIQVSENGTVLNNIREAKDKETRTQFVYELDGSEIIYNHSINTITYKGIEHLQADFSKLNKTYPMGTDYLGRDLLTRVLYGARISLVVAFIATLVSMFLGVIYGSVSGYMAGTVDIIMMRIIDTIGTVPTTLYVILFMVVFNSRGVFTIVLILGFTCWFGMARLVRGKILELRESDYVTAAMTIGVRTRKIITRHLIPNAMGPILVSLTLSIPSAIFTESFLSFLGLGVAAPMSSWGTLASEALTTFPRFAWQLFFPAFAIAFTVLAFNFLGDGLADALDPKQKI